MKKIGIWLQTEYKRAAAVLPLILKRAVILTVVCLGAVGIIALCTKVFWNEDKEMPKLRVGYVAEENMITELAVSYVQNMESVQSLCSLEPIAEQEGKLLLEQGALSALIVLPEDVMNEILSGNNAPAKLYLPKDAAAGGGIRAVASTLFEEFTSACMGMLRTAQAEIYATKTILEDLLQEYQVQDAAVSEDLLQTMYDDINKFNLAVVTKREDLFEKKNLSLTGTDTYTVYFGSALLAVYGLLSGLFWSKYCKRPYLEQLTAVRRMGIGYAVQIVTRCAAGGILAFLVLLLPLVLFKLPFLRTVISVEWTAAGIISLFLITIFIAIYQVFLCEIVEKQESILVVAGVLAVVQAYLSGCLIPSVLLPEAITRIGAWMPAAYMKAGFTVLLTGEVQGLASAIKGLLLWSLILFGITFLWMQAREQTRLPAAEKKALSDKSFSIWRNDSKMHVPSVCVVMLRRLLHKKSIWISMFLVAVSSVSIVFAEKESSTQIKTAVYDMSGMYESLLEDYEGIVDFELYQSEEQVKKAVLNGDVECGYILPEDLTEEIVSQRANQLVNVYQDADAVAVPIVNEILFERIFYQASRKWYEDYMTKSQVPSELGADKVALKEKIDNSFDSQIAAGSTFHFEVEWIGNQGEAMIQDGGKTSYPVFMVASFTVLLCLLQGVLQILSDIRNHCFYKRNRVEMSVITIALPVLMGLLTAFIVIKLVELLL